MTNYHLNPIDASHGTKMLEILRGSPIVTDRMTICFDRQPDIFALTRCKYDDYYYQGLFDGATLKGFGMVGYHTALVNGDPTGVFCARDLYILPEARGRRFVAQSTESHFREHQHLAPLGYGLIMHGNKSSMRFVGNRPDSNHYSPLSRVIGRQVIHTILLALPVAVSRDYIIRRAQTDDIPTIVRLLNAEHKDRLFGKICTETSFQATLQKSNGLSLSDYFLAFDRSGKYCGVCAGWDMSGMKQTRVLKYGRAFLPARAAWKAISILFNRPPLPEPSEHFREVTLTDCAVQDRNPAIMNALLCSIYREYRQLGFHFMVWGSCGEDSLLTAAKGFLSQKIISNIVLFSTQSEWLEEGRVKNHLPYIDISAI